MLSSELIRVVFPVALIPLHELFQSLAHLEQLYNLSETPKWQEKKFKLKYKNWIIIINIIKIINNKYQKINDIFNQKVKLFPLRKIEI